MGYCNEYYTDTSLPFRPVAINPLQVETPEECRLFDLGEKNSIAKKAMAKRALRKQTPNDEESDLIHAMWLKQEAYHGNEALRVPYYTTTNRANHQKLNKSSQTQNSASANQKTSCIWIKPYCIPRR